MTGPLDLIPVAVGGQAAKPRVTPGSVQIALIWTLHFTVDSRRQPCISAARRAFTLTSPVTQRDAPIDGDRVHSPAGRAGAGGHRRTRRASTTQANDRPTVARPGAGCTRRECPGCWGRGIWGSGVIWVMSQGLCDVVVGDGGLAVDEVLVVLGVEDGDVDVVAGEALDSGAR